MERRAQQAEPGGGAGRALTSYCIPGQPWPPSNHDLRDTGLQGTHTPVWTKMNAGFQHWTRHTRNPILRPPPHGTARLWDELRDVSLSLLTCKVG